jgi:hypothetical protein
LVVAVRKTPEVASVSVTVVAGITAPVGSVTMPVTVPVVVACVKAGPGFKNTKARSMKTIAVIDVSREKSLAIWSPFANSSVFYGSTSP